jgi:hypothetical protein
MVRGPRLALPALALLLGLLLGAGPAAASHLGEGVLCSPAWDCHINLRPNEARSADTWVDETAPGRNFDSGDQSEFLVVGAPSGQQAWALLRFPLGDIPRNITLLETSVDLRVAQASVGDQRTLTLWELRNGWSEGSVTWEQAKGFNTGLQPVENMSINGGMTGATLRFGQGHAPDRGVPSSFRKYYLGEEPYHGHVLKDTGGTPLNIPARQRFNSSSDLNALGHRPLLVVGYDPNTPELRSPTVDGGQHVNATSTRPVNLTFQTFDRKGDVVNAWINATELETGKEVFNRSVWANRSTVFINADRHTVWSNASLDLPEGQYIVNYLALDTDGNINYTTFKQANLTVENTPPHVNQTKDPNGALQPFLSATQLDEGQSFAVRVNATDQASPKGYLSGIARVSLALERGGEVVRNVTLQPRKVDANNTGDWEATVVADAAGALNATVWVVDRAGNANRSAPIALAVRDVRPPVIAEAQVLAPSRGAEGAVQEEGGKVAWEARVRDASPVLVTLRLSGPTGDESLPMQRQGLTDRYRYERTFTASGSYGATIVVEDQPSLPPAQRNTALRGQLGFVLLPAAPPVIEDPRPGPGGHGPGRATLSAVVSDLNLDPASLAIAVRVGNGPFLQAEARTETVGDRARKVLADDTFFHGEVVEVRVRAADTLGRSAERSWTFTVDARPPATFLSTEGPALAGERTAITGNTTIRLDRSDQGSGLLATVVAILNEDRALGSGNLTITGSDPATLNLSASPVFTGTGNYTLHYGSVDLAGNAEPPQVRRFLVDDAPPRVRTTFEPGLLTAHVEERGSGLREVRAQYWVSPGGQQGSTLMSPDASRTTWQATVPDAERGSEVLYAVEAVDQLGNTGRAGTAANPLRSVVQNHKPLVSLTPGNGSLVKGVVSIEWAATDRDGDQLQTSLAVRPSTVDQAKVLAPQRGATGAFPWDTTTGGDGLWVVELTATDGFEQVVHRSFVEVTNTNSKVVAFRVQAGEPGQPVRFEATLYKPVQRAEAVVRLGSEEVARVVLRDDGGPPDRLARDGVFTGTFTPQRAADYRVDLDVVFQDGRLEAQDQAAVAHVQYAFPARIVHEPLLLFLVIVIPLGAVGFVLYRRYGLPRWVRQRLRR